MKPSVDTNNRRVHGLKVTEPSSLGYFWHRLIPVFLILFVPNVVVCAISFVVTYASSVSEALQNGFRSFWYDAWTFHGAGTPQTWVFLAIFIAYSGLSLLVLPGEIYYGPPTLTGHRPIYRKTGFIYYVITMVIAAFILLVQNARAWSIYRNLPGVAVSLTIIAYVVTTLLYIKGRVKPSPGEHGTTGSFIFDFYWGLELYPRIGERLDIKQWTNCRFGMMMWQLLVLVSWKAQVETTGWNWSMATTAVLQTVYIAKFYWWEDGYMQTIDIIVDRAGYYICWGCICFLSLMYPLTSLYMVENSPASSPLQAFVIFLMGLTMIGLNYWTDYQRQVVRATNGKCTIWGSPPKLIKASYRDASGKQRTNLLLASGFWSLSRHVNYVFEVLAALCWALPSGSSSIVPYLYVLYLVGLLLHRSYRDEKKCSLKYGHYWKQYCDLVKCQVVPYLF
uniref:7-dehydrocholesterol reductase n=1 Tax=Amblyomma maculatum TaxID=34609 RepID=G3MS90_AMBMU